MLLDLHDNSAEHDSSMRMDEYEEPESVFIPNHATARPAAAAASAPVALSAAAHAEMAPSGLAGLLSYDDDEDEEPAAPIASAIPAVAATAAAAAPSSAAASVRSPSPPLPAGWTACKDEESGDTYWWNENTDETTWDRPAAPSGAPVPPAAVADAKHTDNKDEATAAAVAASATPSPSPTAVASSVNAPPGVAKKALVAADAEMKEGDVVDAVAPAAAAAASPTPEVSATAPQSTEHSPADDNAGDDSHDDDDDLDGDPIGPAEIYPLPAGWHEVETSDGNSPPSSYFFNENTGETTWDRPKLSATEIAAFRAARLEEERFRALQTRAENEIAAAAARKEREERATFLPAAAGSCSQALLISALTAGLQARLRPHLAKGMAPFASTSLGESLSPLLRFHAVLESRIKDWMELMTETPPPALAVIEHAEALWVARLTQATVEIDAVLKADEAWRAERTSLLAAQQYESASLQHKQFLAAQMAQAQAQAQMVYPMPQQQPMMPMQGFAPQPMPMHGYAIQPQQPSMQQPVGIQRFIPHPPPLPLSAPAVPAAPVVAAAAAAAAAPASSGFVHPSRSAHVIVGKPAFTAGVPPPPANRASAGQKRPASAAAAAAGQSGAALAEGGSKKKRVDSQDSKQLGRMVSRLPRCATRFVVMLFLTRFSTLFVSIYFACAGRSGVEMDRCRCSHGARRARGYDCRGEVEGQDRREQLQPHPDWRLESQSGRGTGQRGRSGWIWMSSARVLSSSSRFRPTSIFTSLSFEHPYDYSNSKLELTLESL